MKLSLRKCLVSVLTSVLLAGGGRAAHAILAGDEMALPADSPAIRLDPLGINSVFNSVGALSINAGVFSYIGTGTGPSPNWVLTDGTGYPLGGVNTFIEGYGGRFGDIRGGIVLAPYLDWIGSVTALPVSEPSAMWLLLAGAGFFLCKHTARIMVLRNVFRKTSCKESRAHHECSKADLRILVLDRGRDGYLSPN